MILSNSEIIKGIQQGYFNIEPIPPEDGTRASFNTTAIDLRLSTEIRQNRSRSSPVAIDLTSGGIANFLKDNTEAVIISHEQPYKLKPFNFILGQTLESVSFPLGRDKCYSARVEGKSSLGQVRNFGTLYSSDYSYWLYWSNYT